MTVTNRAGSSAVVPLNTLDFPLWGTRLIEASAGTGKTYTIASLYVRLILGHGRGAEQPALTPPDILVVTFTRAATKELRDRIRGRLTEAAACFLEETEGDDFLAALRDEYPPEAWPGCARQLQIAADWMDDAAVSTIDAWCYRVLREHAFDSGSLFNVEIDVDPTETIAEATRDYWRLFIAPLSADDFRQLIVSPYENCVSLASCLSRQWLARAAYYENVVPPEELIARRNARLEICKQHWSEWVPEMDAILDQAADAKHFPGNKLNGPNRKNWLRQLKEWAEDPGALKPFTRDTPWQRLTPSGLAEIWKEGFPVPQHPGFEALATLRKEIDDACAELDRLLCHAAQWVSGRVQELRSQRAMLGFNGLLEQLDATLQGPNGARLAQLIRRQFPAALIDEFQDTNPVQYRIFDQIYGVADNAPDGLLALIGDPKQAIYGFRGADIHAYLAARRACEGRIYTLGRNFRSSQSMVNAVNHLFNMGEEHREAGAFLFRKPSDNSRTGQNPVPFFPVEAARDPGEFVVLGEPCKALTVWFDAEMREPEEVAAACASEILRLLQLAATGQAGFQGEQGFRSLQAADIAILVNSGKQAAFLGRELRRRGIRSVYLSDKASVFSSPAARDMLAWLRACAEPENGAYVRVALATASLNLDLSVMDTLVHDESRWEAMLERFAGYKEQWRLQGVLPMLRRFMHEFGVPARLFDEHEKGGAEGERLLTDLLHLSELLQAASSMLDGEQALIRYLEQKISAGAEADADEDVSRLRLESDAGLVQIVTVHKAKGLEYPLVFFPYAYDAWVVNKLKPPVVYHDTQGELQVLAHLADADAQTQQRILAQCEHERLAEDLRKLYVALTRSRHACWLALVGDKRLALSAMGYLLGGEEACQPDKLEHTLSALQAANSDIAVQALPQAAEGWWRPNGDAGNTGYTWRSMQRRIKPGWHLSSYSSLSRYAMKQARGDAGMLPDHATPAMPDEARLDTFLEAYQAEDETAAGSRETVPDVAPVSAGLHTFPRGAAEGTFLHDLLEWAFRQGPRRVLAEPGRLGEQVARRCAGRGWDEYAEHVTAWLRDFLTREFRVAPEAGTPPVVLANLSAALPEMEFWFGIRDAWLPRLDNLVSRHFQPGRPRALLTQGRLRGLLRGFIDLVFEHHGRYYVADYKSNYLGTDDTAYDGSAVAEAILDHRYDLQSALYLFALHRLLKSRLGDSYDYDAHIGGALVFFIRGAGSVTQGLHFERPAKAVLEEMDTLFSAEDDACLQEDSGFEEGASCN